MGRPLLSGFRSSVRTKLLVMVLMPLVVVLPALLGLLVYWGNTYYDRLLTFKITSDLAVAHEYFDKVVSGVGRTVGGFAESSKLADQLRAGDKAALAAALAAAREQRGLDFLHLLSASGEVMATGNPLSAPGNYLDWPVVRGAASGEAETAVAIMPPQALARLDVRLRERAYLPLVVTEKAAPSERQSEDRGMVIHSAAPVYDASHRLIGMLHGGVLLNRNLEFVDNINNIVYREGSLPLGSKGTATLFLEDVRIATNVRLFQGERALGTRVSKAVRDQVLGEGRPWLDRAFVVNDWYVSGYEPIVDGYGKRVGMLYVGYLEAPFARAKVYALFIIAGLIVLVSVIASFVSLRWARSIFKPLERMSQTMSAVQAGSVEARVGPVESRDEIGQLATHFDQLLASLQTRNRELNELAVALDQKVVERTRELAEANQHLRDAQRHLVMSEKLAAIGELTAGVAHEINNPVAVIQGNLDLAREILGDGAAPALQEIRIIDRQINRIREIVTKLLQFARPSEYAGYVELVDVNAVVEDCLVLTRHHLRKGDVRVERDCRASRAVSVNRNELQQVMINLMVNAVQAMGDGGVLTLRTRDWDEKGAVITVRDTGPGIRPEDLSRIFDPFYTTKKQHGTGLGLSISYALVERYGGTISVDSTPGAGAEFSVWLLTEPKFMDTTQAPSPSLLARDGQS